jgi:hypothetical protein
MGQNHALQASNFFSDLKIIYFHGSRMFTALIERISLEDPIANQLNPVNSSHYTPLRLSSSGLSMSAVFSESGSESVSHFYLICYGSNSILLDLNT